MVNILNNYLNFTEREGKIFALGSLMSSMSYVILIGLYSNLGFNKRYFTNIITNLKRTKLLNGNKNVFYFDDMINETSLDNFKNFVNDFNDMDETIYIVLSTNGGSFSIAQMISSILLNWKGETNSVILNKAFSAGTLIALSCKNIYMHSNAHLSPVDVIHNTFFDTTQLSSITNVLSNKNPDKINDNTYILADQAKKCKLILNKIFDKICTLHKFNEETKNKVYQEIFEGEKYIHCTTFSKQDLIDIGICVNPMTDELLSLSKLTKKYDKNYF